MPPSLEHLVTVVIVTSPVLSHPSLALLERTLSSYAHVPSLHACNFIIVADGFRVAPGDGVGNILTGPAPPCGVAAPRKHLAAAFRQGLVDADYAARYGEMKARLAARVEADAGLSRRDGALFANCKVLEMDERVGFGFALKAALEEVTTKYIVVNQHDRTWMRFCDVGRVVQAMEGSVEDGIEGSLRVAADGTEQVVKVVSFLTRSTLNYTKRTVGRETWRGYEEGIGSLTRRPPCLVDDGGGSVAALFPLLQFYDSTHVALAEYYRGFIFARETHLVARGGFVEDKVSNRMMESIKKRGLAGGHRRYGVYLYDDGLSWDGVDDGKRHAHRGDGVTAMVGHLDGRSLLTEAQRSETILASETRARK